MEKFEKILIFKTGYIETLAEEGDSRVVSLGDVFRTTVLLNLYSDKKRFNVTWVTDEKAFPLLEKNPLIDRLLRLDWITAEQLKKERFDVLINLEKVPGICALADIISSRIKSGFTFNPETRKAEPYDNAAQALFVSSDPEAKKNNNRLLQELLYEMVGKKWNGEEYILGYQPASEVLWDIGLNTNVGPKWPTKSWTKEKWDELEDKLKRAGFKVDRQDSEENIKKGVMSDLHAYIKWINSCKNIITIDSLGLHLAIALKKNILCLFGPTPSNEVHFYERGKAMLPEIKKDCIPCFKGICEKEKRCIDEISVDKVYNEALDIFQLISAT